jgi:Ni,Fe-hydrogenase III large subunit/NADH:ubiquinone oxidoreductase subunit C
MVFTSDHFDFRECAIMNEINTDRLGALQTDLQSAAINYQQASTHSGQWHIDAVDWQRFAELANRHKLRWVAGWAEQLPTSFAVHACFQLQHQYLWLQTLVSLDQPELPSQATIYPSASRSERHTQDMFGLHFSDHPDSRPWLRHQAWGKHDYPLRKDFPLQGQPVEVTPPDLDYQFIKARGAGVYEIPVGPVHAGIIEPGHFRFQAVGETILNLEERLGYVHKGIEKLAEGRTPQELLRLAGRISGDTTVAHSWAACRAMEQAAAVDIPNRAAFIRGLLCERERIANHLGDIGAICNDVGFAFAQMQFTRLRELWLRSQARIFGHRLLMDLIQPGGVKIDLSDENCSAMHNELEILRAELDEIIPALDLNSSLEDRLYTTGFLSEATASLYGAVGYVGRASGQDFDARRDVPYPPYDQLSFKVAVEKQGDVASRVWIRIKEINASIKLLSKMLQQLPAGDVVTEWQVPAKNSTGLAMIEGWRGEIVSYVRFGADNKINRFYSRDPSAVNWPVLERIVLNNIVPDFPVCNKSLNGSYSGHDL